MGRGNIPRFEDIFEEAINLGIPFFCMMAVQLLMISKNLTVKTKESIFYFEMEWILVFKYTEKIEEHIF